MGTKVYFSSWRGEKIDNRDKLSENWVESTYNFPVQYSASGNATAFVGWEGIALFRDDIDVVRLATEYASQYQKYSEACGRCAPGRWGGRILYDLFDKIARGDGDFSDLTHLKEVSETMMETSKCEIGKTVPVPLLILIKEFEEEFIKLIKNKTKSKDYDNNVNYNALVTAPCTDACPAHVDIPAYIEGVRDFRFDDSLKATRQTMPLAHTCGRVCPHPCETACRRTNIDEPISIMELKRIGADYETDHNLDFIHPVIQKAKNGKKVAVIGGGPAGLTGAYYLALDGIEVDLFEALPVLGGEVAVGVPEYRMPIDKYNQDIELVKSVGVNIYLNSWIDVNKMREFEKKYDAILVATGTRISKKVDCANERPEIQGYWGAIDFLDKINLYEKYGYKLTQEDRIKHNINNEYVDLTGKTIACVGGGFTSMDVVRCSIRAGAKRVIMLYRRDEATIIKNTTYEEYHEAVEEGVEFIFYSAVEKMIDEKDVLKHLHINNFKMQSDSNGGRPKLVKVHGGDFMIDVDYLIPAVSQSADLSLLPPEWNIELTSWKTIKTNGRDYMTSKRGVFAAGDVEYGPMTIVNAVGQAKRASSVISRFVQTGEISLTDNEIMEEHLRKLGVYNKKEKISGWLAGQKRSESEKLSVDERKTNNREVNFGFTAEEAISEAERCMRCYYISMVAR